MAVEIIDELEIIDVKLCHDARLVWMPADMMIELVVEAASVIDTGELIGFGKVAEILPPLLESDDCPGQSGEKGQNHEAGPEDDLTQAARRPGAVRHELELPEIATERKPVGDRIHERLLRVIELDGVRIPWGRGLQKLVLVAEEIE